MKQAVCTVLGGAALVAALSLLAVPLPARAQAAAAPQAVIDATTAIDMAGRQRMLSQRMVKAYLLLVQGVAVDDARATLQQSIARFESHLAALQAWQPTPAVRSALAALDAEWAVCKALLARAPARAAAVELYDSSEALQRAAHRVTLAYERISGAALDHLVNLAGRQRMLSQRMAKFHLYRASEILGDAAEMELHLSRAHFTAVLLQIERSPHASGPIRDGVARVRQQWEPYQQALFASREPARMRAGAARVGALSEQVLAAAEELVALIVKDARRG